MRTTTQKISEEIKKAWFEIFGAELTDITIEDAVFYQGVNKEDMKAYYEAIGECPAIVQMDLANTIETTGGCMRFFNDSLPLFRMIYKK